MLTLSRSLTHTRTVAHTKLSIHSFVYWIHYILNASIRFKASHQLFFLCTVMRTLAVCHWLYSLPHWTNVCHADRGIKHKTCHKPDSERWRKNLATGVVPEALLNWSGERTHDEIRDGWICGPSHYCTYCCKSVSPLSMQPARKHYNFKSIYYIIIISSRVGVLIPLLSNIIQTLLNQDTFKWKAKLLNKAWR